MIIRQNTVCVFCFPPLVENSTIFKPLPRVSNENLEAKATLIPSQSLSILAMFTLVMELNRVATLVSISTIFTIIIYEAIQ